MDDFLRSIERRAFLMARIRLGNDEDAFDVIQDSMLNLVGYYAGRDPAQWGPLFYRILHNRINDLIRRRRIGNRLFGWIERRRSPGAADKGVFQLARDDRERQKGHGNGQDGAADARRHDKPGGAGAERWQRLSPDEKERLKSRQRQFEKLSPDEQRRIREAEREYRRMSPEERQELRKKWERMSEEERARYRRKVDNKNRN